MKELSKLEFAESSGYRAATIKLRMEYETVNLGTIYFPVTKDEPWEDVVDYFYSNIELWEVEDA
jgi:hypothetical protein